MSKAVYLQRGESLDYLNETAETIEANTIVPIIGRIGIAGAAIHPNEKGSLHVAGVFEIGKTCTEEIKQGMPVYFDGTGITDSAKSGDSEEENTPAGYAAQTAQASDLTVVVKLPG